MLCCGEGLYIFNANKHPILGLNNFTVGKKEGVVVMMYTIYNYTYIKFDVVLCEKKILLW